MQQFVHNLQVSRKIIPTLIRPPDLRAGFAAEVNDLTGSGLVHAGEQWAPARFMIEEHTHAVWEWYLQMHGMTRWFADRQLWTIRPGDLFGVAPDTRHAMAETPGVNHHFYYAAFDPAPVLGRQVDLREAWPVRAKAVHLTDASGLIDPFAQLIKELTVSQNYLDVGLRLAIDRLLLELTRRLQQGQPIVPSGSTRPCTRSRPSLTANTPAHPHSPSSPTLLGLPQAILPDCSPPRWLDRRTSI